LNFGRIVGNEITYHDLFQILVKNSQLLGFLAHDKIAFEVFFANQSELGIHHIFQQCFAAVNLAVHGELDAKAIAGDHYKIRILTTVARLEIIVAGGARVEI